MSFQEIALIMRWIVPVWVLGWLVLPLSSRLFGALPDCGLATGRILFLVSVGLIAFWGACLHFAPLRLTPLLLVLAFLAIATGWKNPRFRAAISSQKRALLCSDAVFLLSFGAFLWVRLRHPEAGDLEKPMDMALLSSAMRADWLPFENPWFAGQSFTNYYYFGPFLASLLGRTLAAPPALAYNLAQPIFCAFFLSSLWSIAAALSRSLKIGFLAVLLVGVGGHFEPLRQWSQTGKIWPLDWWKTSRVIDFTINEYPAFTMLTGDLHGHFFAFCLATTHFCTCFCLLRAASGRQKSALLLLGGVLLGVFVLTNTWDTPFYGLLWLFCAFWNRKTGDWTRQNGHALWVAIGLAPLVALPYLLRFKSQISGVVFAPWLPNLFSLSLLWGGWWMLGFWALTLDAGEAKPSPEAIFRRFLVTIGALALIFPFVFYIRGIFGDGDYRHQDTVFKFGLQAWLLLGTGIACEAGFRFKSWWHQARSPLRFASLATGAALFGILSLAPACVAWTRTTRDASRDAQGNIALSLNAARYLPAEEQQGIEWLRRNARPGDSLVEAIGNDYDANFGRIAAFSGVPSVLGWRQHVAGWGATGDEIARREALIREIFGGAKPADALQQLGATYIFFGAREWNPDAVRRFARPDSGLQRVWPDFDAGAPQILRLKRIP